MLNNENTKISFNLRPITINLFNNKAYILEIFLEHYSYKNKMFAFGFAMPYHTDPTSLIYGLMIDYSNRNFLNYRYEKYLGKNLRDFLITCFVLKKSNLEIYHFLKNNETIIKKDLNDFLIKNPMKFEYKNIG